MDIRIDVGQMANAIRDYQRPPASSPPGPREVTPPETKASPRLLDLAAPIPPSAWRSAGVDLGSVPTHAQVARAANAWLAIEQDNWAQMVADRVLAAVAKEHRR